MYDVPSYLHGSLKKQFCSLPKLYFMAESAHLLKINNAKKNKKLCIQPVIHCKFREVRQKKLQFRQLMKQIHKRRKSFSNNSKSQLSSNSPHKKYSLQHKNTNNVSFPLRVDNISFCKRKIDEYDQQLIIQRTKVKQEKRSGINNDEWRYYNKLSELSYPPLEYVLSNRSIVINKKHKKMQTEPSAIEQKYKKAIKKMAKLFPHSLQLKKNIKIKHELSPWEAEGAQQYCSPQV